MQEFLASCEIIDWQTESVKSLALDLTRGADGEQAKAEACFEYVRDQIKHSTDYQLEPLTCSASQVLEHGTGLCYAKSHLLAALLRVNQIPAGLSYQRLSMDDQGSTFGLHGLNSIYLQSHGWYRVDPRGNKAGVNARFSPPHEQLAFPIVLAGEADLAKVWAQPMPEVVAALTSGLSVRELSAQLPDSDEQ